MSENPYELIGKAVVAWNRIDGWWQEIFTTLLDAPKQQGDLLYLTLANAKAQSDIIKNLANLKLDQNGNARRRIHEALSKTSEVAGLRNVIAHSRYISSPWSLSVDEPFKYPPRQSEFIGKDVVDEMRAILAKIDECDAEVWAAMAAIWVETGKRPSST